MAVKKYAYNDLLKYEQIKLDWRTREKLSDGGVIYLEDLGINYYHVFANCLHQRWFQEFYVFEISK